MKVKEGEGKGERVWSGAGKERGRRENRAFEKSRVVISASCVCNGGFYAEVFILGKSVVWK